MDIRATIRLVLQEAWQWSCGDETQKALACCDRADQLIGMDPMPAERALAVFHRAVADMWNAPDQEALERVAPLLITHTEWEPAMSAHAMLARAAANAGDLAKARRMYVLAVGCAEAGGTLRTAASFLVDLARAELHAGHPDKAIDHAHHALWRLKHVRLLGARASEAECHDLLGDAHWSLNDAAHAKTSWEEALERYQRLEHGAAQRVRAKLASHS